MKSEILRIIEAINKALERDNLTDEFKAKYMSCHDGTEVVMLEDFDALYFETIVIYEDKVHFFGENYDVPPISRDELITNLKDTWNLKMDLE